MADENLFFKLSYEYSLCGLIFFRQETMEILSSNRQAQAYLCENPEETIVGRPIGDILSPNMDRSILMKEEFYGELILRRFGGGREFPVLAKIRTIHQGGKNLSILNFQDISSQKKVHRDLMAKQEGLKEILHEMTAKNEELQKLDKAKDKFLSLVTHELRTPLNTLVATSEMLHYKMYDTTAEYDELAKNLYLQSHQMLDLVNDILDMTKIRSGKIEFYIEQGEPYKALVDQKNLFSDMAAQNGIQILLAPPDRPLLCYFDEIHLKQIFANLISNAIKFNRAGGQVTIQLVDRDDFVEVSIADNGIGIPEDKFNSIFNEFETIEQIAHHHKGTGLGLPIVRSLVLGLGGKIHLESKIGHGTTFFVSLPKAKVLDESVYRSRQEEGVVFFDEEPGE